MTSSRRPDNWIVPGGGVEPNEEPASTAVREVLEEAGVVGTLGRCLGMFEVNYCEIFMFVFTPLKKTFKLIKSIINLICAFRILNISTEQKCLS